MPKSKHGLTFSHQTTSYTFQGEPLPLPAPGSYDASAWTPPTHRMYTVEFQSDGLWSLMLNKVAVDQGDYEKPSRKRALELIEEYRDRQEKLRGSLA